MKKSSIVLLVAAGVVLLLIVAFAVYARFTVVAALGGSV
jgi:hypothetical protein